ncbi:hypothetical protein J7894_03445 [Mycoplasmopsis agalactiae]|nr:hypothetical protein [Mycoplasmopsis agalactiae]MCE6091058.1 hypothetical protein [Mycoplasmopsis agalactiae]
MSRKKEVRFRVKGFIVLTIFLLMAASPLMANVFLAPNSSESTIWIVRYIKLTATNIKMNFATAEDGTGGFFVHFYKAYFQVLASRWSNLGIADILLIILAFAGSQLFLILSIIWLLHVLIAYGIFNLFKGKSFILYALFSLLLFAGATTLYALLYFEPFMIKNVIKSAASSNLIIFINKWLIWILSGILVAQLVLVCIELATVKRVNSNIRAQTLEMQ